MTQTVRRYLFMTLGLVFNAASGVLCIKASLGTSPIASLPYTLNQILPTISVGTFSFMVNLAFLGLTIIVLGREFRLIQVLQIPFSFLFGLFMDGWMLIFENLVPETYIQKIILILLGCCLSGFGFSIIVTSGVAMEPNTSMLNAISKRTGILYGRLKVVADVLVVITSSLLSIIFLHRVVGVREGTVISAILIGYIAGFFNRWMPRVSCWILGEKKTANQR